MFRNFGDVNFVRGYDIPRDLNGYADCPPIEGEMPMPPAPPRVLVPAASAPKPFWYFVAGFVLCRFLTK